MRAMSMTELGWLPHRRAWRPRRPTGEADAPDGRTPLPAEFRCCIRRRPRSEKTTAFVIQPSAFIHIDLVHSLPGKLVK